MSIAYWRRFVFLLQLFPPPLQSAFSCFNLILLPHSMHCRFAVPQYHYSPCHSQAPCQQRELLFAPPVLPVYLLKLQQPTKLCFVRNRIFSLFSFFFFFIVRRVFVFALAALCPIASLTNLQQQKNQYFKDGCRQQLLLAWYILLAWHLQYLTLRRVNEYKETVWRFGRIQGPKI